MKGIIEKKKLMYIKVSWGSISKVELILNLKLGSLGIRCDCAILRKRRILVCMEYILLVLNRMLYIYYVI